MLTRPKTHGPGTTLGELRAFFEDDHVHVALLVDEGKLLGVVEHDDLELPRDDRTPDARSQSSTAGRSTRTRL